MSISANFNNARPSLLLDFSNAQQLDPRVTFSRSTTAPYYDGKTSVLAEQNLYKYSQGAFSNSTYWGSDTFIPVVTDNTVSAPDGTTTASTISFTAQYQNIRQTGFNLVSGVQYTLSLYVYVASGTRVFSVTDGASNSYGTYTATTSWSRYALTFTALSSTVLYLIQDRNATGFVNAFIWGAQLEQRSSVTAYNATTTSAITNYIPQLLTAPINAPRFDFNPTTGESLGLLLEQSSTNLLTYSQDFTNGVWTKGNATITASANIAPDGTQTAQQLVENTSNTSHTIQYSASITPQTYSFSIYIKSAGRTFAQIQSIANTANTYATINLTTGVVGTVSGSGTVTATSVGNGWWRCTVTNTSAITGTGLLNIYTALNSTTSTYTGDGYSGIYIWGAQLEALAFPTSYIATTSAQVTRAIDYPIMTGTNFNSWYNISQGTVLVLYDFIFPTSIANAGIFSLNNGSSSTRMDLRSNAANNTSNGTALNSATTSGQTFNNTLNKASLSYIVTTSNGVINGGSVSSYSLATMPQVTQLQLGNLDNSTFNPLNGHIRKFAYYPLALTGAQNQALTGL
jgi:hypothetical protein